MTASGACVIESSLTTILIFLLTAKTSGPVFGRPLDIMIQNHCIFHKAYSVYHNLGVIVFDKLEAERLAAALGPYEHPLLDMKVSKGTNTL